MELHQTSNTQIVEQISQVHTTLYKIPNTKPIMLMPSVHPTSRLFQAVEVGHVCRCRDDMSPRVKHSGCAWKFMVSASMITVNPVHGLEKNICRLNVLFFLFSLNNSPTRYPPLNLKHQDSSRFQKN